MRFSFTVTMLGAATLACTTPRTVPADSTAPDATVHAPGGGGRPVELDYKDQREQRALAGLSYGTRVTVDVDEARQLVGDQLGAAPERARQSYQEGLTFYATNARLEAIAAHTRAVLFDPTDGRLYEGLGDALRAERYESRAEAAYRTGLDLAPSAGLHTRLAEILWMRADREGAIAEALLALELQPNDARANANLARWYYFTNDYALAWQYVHRSEELGVPLPSQFRPLLAARMPEPRR